MKASNAAVELAEQRVEQEAAAGIARARAALTGTSGRLVCDCGEPISEARRRAVPNTDQCINCATFAERSGAKRTRRSV